MTWQQLHAVSDRLTPGMIRALMEAFGAAKRGVPTSALIRAINSGGLDPGEVQRLLQAVPALVRQASQTAMTAAVTQAAAGETQTLSNVGIRMSFDMVNPMAVQAAREQAALMVTRVTEQTRRAIQTIAGAAIESGITAPNTARLIKTVIGLNPGDAMAVANFRARLDKAGWKSDRITSAIDRYAAKKLRERSQMIARTELIDSLTRGQQAVWQQAQARGFLNEHAQQEWLVTPDDRLCPICQQMQGARAPVGGFFETPLGPRRGPTLHPHCRCVLRLAASSLRGPAARRAAERLGDAPGDVVGQDDFLEADRPAVAAFARAAANEAERLAQIKGLKRLKVNKLSLRPGRALTDGDGKISRGVIGRYTYGGKIELAYAPELRGIADVAQLGKFGVNDSPIGVFRHEVGHLVEERVLTAAARKEWTSLWRQHGEQMARRVSTYAATSPAEAFAESFTAYIHPGGGPPLPAPYQAFFTKWLKTGGQ